MMHLWEVDHPYYCSESNYYSRDCHNRYESWAEFTATTFYDGDPDMNLVFRWDWNSWRRHPDPDLRSDSPDRLELYFMLQRKGIFCVASIAVTDDDEPAVRAWLAERAKTITALWEPLSLAPEDES